MVGGCLLGGRHSCGAFPQRTFGHGSARGRGGTVVRCEKAEQTQPAVRLPRSKEEIIEQAFKASLAAYREGKRRQRLEVLLPLIGATELDDWRAPRFPQVSSAGTRAERVTAPPATAKTGGIRQEFKAAQPMMEDLLRRLKKEEDLQGPLSPEIWDQGDAVGSWQSPKLGLILFLTGETLRKAKRAAEQLGGGLLLMVNPQWKGGQLVSDLGVGPWRRANEEFVASFEETYVLRRLRISGDNVRLLKQYPGPWNVFLTSENGEDECLAVQDAEPSYTELQALLRDTPSSMSSKSLIERLQAEYAFNKNSLKQ